jgi:hypothetical protein
MLINQKFIVAHINQLCEFSRIAFNRLVDDYSREEGLTPDEIMNAAYCEFMASYKPLP